jgi:hypothetical protein
MLPLNARRVLRLAADLEAEQTPAPPVDRVAPSPPESGNEPGSDVDSEPQRKTPIVSREKILRDGRAALARGVDYLELRERIAEQGHDPNDFGPDVNTEVYSGVRTESDSKGRTKIIGIGPGFEDDLGLFGEAGPNRLGGEDKFVPLKPDNSFIDLRRKQRGGQRASSTRESESEQTFDKSGRGANRSELPRAVFVEQGDGEEDLVQIKGPAALATGPELLKLGRPGGGNLLARGVFVGEKLGATIDFDESGNPIAVFPDGERFPINEPGPSDQDLIDGTVFALPTAIGGGVAKIGKKALGMAISLGGRALTEGANDLRGTTEPLKQAVEGFAEEGGEGLTDVEPQVRSFLLNFLSSPAFFDTESGRLTERGGQAVADAGINPRLFTPRFIADFKRISRALEDREVKPRGDRDASGGRRARVDPDSLEEAALVAAGLNEPLTFP